MLPVFVGATMNSSKHNWLDRIICSYERSENRGGLASECNTRGIIEWRNRTGWTVTKYRCRECRCTFDAKGKHFPIIEIEEDLLKQG